MAYPYMKDRNWLPEEGVKVVMLDLEESRSNNSYRHLVGKTGRVISSRKVDQSEHYFIYAEFDGYGREEMYSWRLGPYKFKPNWEV